MKQVLLLSSTMEIILNREPTDSDDADGTALPKT